MVSEIVCDERTQHNLTDQWLPFHVMSCVLLKTVTAKDGYCYYHNLQVFKSYPNQFGILCKYNDRAQ